MTLKLRDTFSLSTGLFSILVQALIYGSVFLLMPLTESGLYSRGGALFGALLLNALVSIGEIAGVFMGRLTLNKQRSYAMYPPAAHHLGQVVVDIPFAMLQCFLFSVIGYWMYGLGMSPSLPFPF